MNSAAGDDGGVRDRVVGGQVEIVVDGEPIRVQADASLAAVLLDSGVASFRTSATGAVRGPLCGMGTCHECRVTIDDVPHRRACLEAVWAGMRVDTHA